MRNSCNPLSQPFTAAADTTVMRTPIAQLPAAGTPAARHRHSLRPGLAWCVTLSAVAGTLTLTALPAAAVPAGTGAHLEASATYTNPLSPLDTPDPDVVEAGGTYYSFSTGDFLHNVSEMSAPTLTSWPTKVTDPHFTDALACTSGAPPSCPVSAWGSHTRQHAPWAPSVLAWDGTDFLFYAAWDASVGHYCIGVATSPTIAGPYRDTTAAPVVCQTDIGGSIDPAAFLGTDGNAYLVWKNNDGFGSSAPATLWGSQIARDPNGVHLVGPTVALLHQDQSWETTIENPFMAELSGNYVLLFSGGLWNTATYAIGYAMCQGPLGPCATPFDHPVLSSTAAVAGPGAPSVFTDTSGVTWLAYHAWTGDHIGYPDGARSLRIDPLCLVGGQPVLLGPSSTPQPLTPSCPTQVPEGYRLVAGDGGLFSYGAPFDGSMGGQPLSAPIVGMAADPATGGYWEVAADGGVFAFGAPFFGSMGGQPLHAPVVAMAAAPDGGGYWLVASDGGVFAFGDAPFLGSMGGAPLHAPVVGVAVDQWTGGYWEVAADGGIFAFGAPFLGSMGGAPLDAPVVGVAAAAGGSGYWEVAADGGIFAFGAPFLGSMGGVPLDAPVVGVVADGFGPGYWEVAADGGIFSFGDAPFGGSAAGLPLVAPVVGMAPA